MLSDNKFYLTAQALTFITTPHFPRHILIGSEAHPDPGPIVHVLFVNHPFNKLKKETSYISYRKYTPFRIIAYKVI